MGKKLDNIKYGGEMAKHFTGKALCAADDFWGGIPLYIALGTAVFSSMYMNMEDMDTTGTDQQEAVYQQASAGIDTLESMVGVSQDLYEMRDGLESILDSGMQEDVIRGDIEINSKLEEVSGKIFTSDRAVENQLKKVLSDVYLAGDETGLALSETSLQSLLTRIDDINISNNMVSDDMKLWAMSPPVGVAEHLDEAFLELDIPSTTIVKNLSERYELAEKVAFSARSDNKEGELGLLLWGILSVFAPSLVSCNTGYDSTLKNWKNNKPKKPKVKNH